MSDALLLISCSARKSRLQAGRAWDVYDGHLYRVLKKLFLAHRNWRERLDILIVSAKYGVLTPDERIETYDLKMSSELVAAHPKRWRKSLVVKLTGRMHRRVFVNLGAVYLSALPGLAEALGTKPEYAAGPIGVRTSTAKHWALKQLEQSCPQKSFRSLQRPMGFGLCFGTSAKTPTGRG